MSAMEFQLVNKSIYFASDFHLGAPSVAKSRLREAKIVRWLTCIEGDAEAIFLVGDIFDFWFEYKHTIPKGFSRLLGKLADLTDKGIPVYFFSGNHDMWMFDYFEQEFGIKVFHEPVSIKVNGKDLYIGHGDGLGPGDGKYKLLKKVFRNTFAQWIFGWLHPNIGIAIAQAWSRRSRLGNEKGTEIFRGNDEWLWQYCKEIEAHHHHDLYIFGHRHLPLELDVSANSKYYNLGEWINYCTYLKIDGSNAQLLKFE